MKKTIYFNASQFRFGGRLHFLSLATKDIHGSSDEPGTPQDISFDVDDLTPSCHNTIENGHFQYWEARAE